MTHEVERERARGRSAAAASNSRRAATTATPGAACRHLPDAVTQTSTPSRSRSRSSAPALDVRRRTWRARGAAPAQAEATGFSTPQEVSWCVIASAAGRSGGSAAIAASSRSSRSGPANPQSIGRQSSSSAVSISTMRAECTVDRHHDRRAARQQARERRFSPAVAGPSPASRYARCPPEHARGLSATARPRRRIASSGGRRPRSRKRCPHRRRQHHRTRAQEHGATRLVHARCPASARCRSSRHCN